MVSTEKGQPADGKLLKGDEIVAVDGKPVSEIEAVGEAVRAREPGRAGDVRRRQGRAEARRRRDRPSAERGKAIVGVTMQAKYKFPFKVDINVGDVGGPSAGLMFSLGIVDKLTRGPLTGGKQIAGTGHDHPRGRGGPDRRHRPEDGRRP